MRLFHGGEEALKEGMYVGLMIPWLALERVLLKRYRPGPVALSGFLSV